MATAKKPAAKKKVGAVKSASKPAAKPEVAQKSSKTGARTSAKAQPRASAPAPRKSKAPLNPPKVKAATPRPLTDQQRMFVSEYLKDRKAGPAARRAGYGDKNADSMGWQLLQIPAVRAAIDAGLEKMLTDNGLTAERTIKEMARLAYFDPAKAYDKDGKLLAVRDMDEDTRAALVGIEIIGTRASKAGETAKVRWADKAAALRMAAQHHGLLKERVELTGKDGGPVEVRELSNAERAVRLAALLAAAAKRAGKK